MATYVKHRKTRRSDSELAQLVQDGTTTYYDTRTKRVRVVRWDGQNRFCDPHEISARSFTPEYLAKNGYKPFAGKLPKLGSSWTVKD